MISPFERSGFVLQESTYCDLEMYRRNAVGLIAMTKFKGDKKAFRQASNQIDPRMIEELLAAFREWEQRPDCAAVVLASSHRVAFSRGAGIELLQGADTETCRLFIDKAQALVLAVQRLTKPVIAAIGGLALGGGLELAMACDRRVSGDRENVVFGQPEALLGIIPAMGGTQNLPRLVGMERAMDIMLNARSDVSPAEGLSCGLVDKVVPEEQLVEEAFAVAASVPAKRVAEGFNLPAETTTELIRGEIDEFLAEHPPESGGKVAPLSKALLTFIADKTLPGLYMDGLLYEREVFSFLQQTADFREGVKALVEERPPLFEGR